MRKTVAVLITCHNRKDKTISCLQLLYSCQPYKDYFFDTYLVDDGSTDGTRDAILSAFPSVNLIQGSGNLFWNGGMHLAWQVAAKKNKYDFFLWLNDDVLLFPNAVNILFATLNQVSPDSIICGQVCSNKTNLTTYGGINDKGKLLVPNGQAQKCAQFNGNCLLVPFSVFKKNGNLDPIFPHAIGDLDYGLRAKKKGISAYITLSYVGNCEHNPTPPKWCLSSTPFLARIKNLYSPLGYSHPYYQFIFERRHYGLFIATKHFFAIHLRLFFPKLWNY